MPFAAVPRKAFLVQFSRTRPSSRFEHTIGGKNDIPGADCLPCKRPLLLMMSLDVRDPRLSLALPRGRQEDLLEGKPQDLHGIPLLYCWSCGPCLDYRVNPEGGVDVLNHSKMASWPDSCWPYEPYPDFFPRKYLRLTPMSLRAQKVIRQKNAGTLSDKAEYSSENRDSLMLKHQVGGEPYIQQGGGTPKCALCDKPAPFVASVAETTGGKKQFFPYGVQVLFFYCAPCQVVSTYHDCD